MADKEPNTYAKSLASGATLWSWQPTSRDMKNRCPLGYTALGNDFAPAMVEARELNTKLYAWRKEHRAGKDDVTHIKGTLNWLFSEFEKKGLDGRSDGYKDSVSRAVVRITGLTSKASKTPLGKRDLDKVSISTATGAYKRLVEKHGLSSANQAITIAVRAWTVCHRLHERYVPEKNPFSHVERRYDEEETIPATYAHLSKFIEQALADQEIAMAFAARLIWDMHIRPTEVFTSTVWDHWLPDHEPDSFFVGVDKTSKGKQNRKKASAWSPVYAYYTDEDGNQVRECLFPELVALVKQLRTLNAGTDLMAVRELRRGTKVFTGEWEAIKQPSKVARRIRDRAGLPEYVTLESFRHGGLTEVAASGAGDTLMMARGRHKQRSTLSRYAHTDRQQAIDAQRLRIAHRKEG